MKSYPFWKTFFIFGSKKFSILENRIGCKVTKIIRIAHHFLGDFFYKISKRLLSLAFLNAKIAYILLINLYLCTANKETSRCDSSTKQNKATIYG